MSRYLNFLERAKNAHGEKFDDSELSKQYVLPFENGNRIEVGFSDGIVKRGRVGVTTGWRPVFILLLTVRSIGSSYILSDETYIRKIIK